MKRMGSPFFSDWREAVASSTVALLVVGSAMAIGGVHPATVLVLFAVATVGTGIGLGSTDWRRRGTRAFGPAFALAGLSAYSALQAIPLPMTALSRLAPANADVWAGSLSALGAPGPAYASVSLDPGASIIEALKWAIYSAVFALSAWLASRRSATRVVGVVFASSVLVAIVTLWHGLVRAERVFGIYTSEIPRPTWHMGPLLNPNNLAGYLNIGIILGLGLLLSPRSKIPRGAVALGVSTLAAEEIIAASRGGVAVLPIGVAALGWFAYRAGMFRKRRALAWATIGSLTLGVVLAALGTTQASWEELNDQSTLKISMLGWARPMIAEYWRFGVGRGAFESAFPAYRAFPGNLVFTHAENFPAQWLSEWGVPVGASAILGVFWLMCPRAFGARGSVLAAAVWCAVFVVFVQNLFDLALEVPAVCIALAAVLGASWGERSRSGSSANRPEPLAGTGAGWRRYLPAVALAIASVGPLSYAWKYGMDTVETDRVDVQARVLEYARTHDAATRVAVTNALVASMRRHPADPYFPLAAALTEWVTHDNSAMLGVERSLERGVVNSRAHLLLAEILLSRARPAQARLELRLAVQDDPLLVGVAAPLAVVASADNEQVLETIPPTPAGVQMLEAVADRVGSHRQMALLEEASRREPDSYEPHERLAGRYVAYLRAGDDEGPCGGSARTECVSRLAVHVEVVQRERPTWSEGFVWQAWMMALNGGPLEGAKLLEHRCLQVDDRFDCMAAEAELLIEGKQSAECVALLRKMMGEVCASPPQCAARELRLGDLFGARGDWGNALTHYTKAAEAEPSVATWTKAAGAAAAAGAHGGAAHALEAALRMQGDAPAPELRARLEEERGRALKGLLEP